MGLRQSLGQLAAFLPLTTHEVATGTRAFDWIIPKEWNIRDAYIKDSGSRAAARAQGVGALARRQNGEG
jgi:aminopeptidase-like protein